MESSILSSLSVVTVGTWLVQIPHGRTLLALLALEGKARRANTW